jgi:hypothetical protein
VPSSILEQRENESAWRQLIVQGVLVVLLPTEDLGNGCLRALVTEIFAEMILGTGISGRACEGWVLWEAITRIAEVLQDRKEESRPKDTTSEQSLDRLERYGLLALPADGRTGSATPLSKSEGRHWVVSMGWSGLFWTVVQYAFLACTALRAVVMSVATSFSLPPRSGMGPSGQSPVEANRQSKLPEVEDPAARRPLASIRPILSMSLWSCATQIIELNSRMPWLSGLISMLHWAALAGPGRVGDTDGVLDR